MKRLLAVVALAAAGLTGACAHAARPGGGAPAATPAPAGAIFPQAPQLLAPDDGVVVHQFPRTIVFQWTPVSGAASYAIEIDCFHCCATGQWCSEARGSGYVVADLKQPTYTFDFWGDQPGRWRVWAIGADLAAGKKSDWRGFVCQSAARPPGAAGAGMADPVTGHVYSAQEGLTFPKAVYAPNPQYTDRARRDKLSGQLALRITIAPDGTVQDVQVQRSLRADLDASAAETVKTWRFEPARKAGQAIAVRVTVEVSFNLR